ncbi:MAG: hypothetical protein M1268_03250 [Patescibacteria group bacterium]|nr:hypothetical protein [Patescibacteria group bacterium]
MINKGGILGDIAGEILEQGGAITKQTAQQIAGNAPAMVKTAGSQIASGSSDQSAQKPDEINSAQQKSDQAKQTQDIVKSFYGVGDKNVNANQNNSQQNQIQKIAEKHPEKTPEEIQKMQKLRAELHQTTYYQPLTNPPKPPEERQGEKIQKEEEEKKKMEELQIKEEKKKEPIAVQRAQNKTEAFRGASG